MTQLRTEQLEGSIGNYLLTGWIEANETWTYLAATGFTVPGDQTAKYTKGTKIKLTNGTVKYFYVVDSSYSSPNTTVAVTGEVNLASGAITSPYYSYMDVPQGMKPLSHYSFGANTTESRADGVQSNITSYSDIVDPNSNFSSGVYTAPFTGRYLFVGCLGIENMPANTRIYATLITSQEDAFAMGTSNSANHDPSVVVSLIVVLNKGNQAVLNVYHDAGSTLPLRNSSRFSGTFLGV